MYLEKVIDIYISQISICSSFNYANKLSEYLPYLTNLSNYQLNRIINVYDENSQIRSYRFNKLGKKKDCHLNRIKGKEKYKIDKNTYKIREI